jgi:uncharacterized membrane protein YbhN (UPF0104 family)
MGVILHRRPVFGRWRTPAIHSNAIRILGSAAILCVLALSMDFRAVGTALFSSIDKPSLLTCVGLLVFSQYLSSVRLHALLRDHAVEAPYRDVARANIYGIVGGMLLFNVFGQGATRTVLLSHQRVPPPMIFFLTLLERAIALLVLLIVALVAAAVLFRRIPLPAGDGGALLVQYAGAATFAIAGVTWLGLKQRQRRSLFLICASFASIATLRLIALTLLMHVAMLVCYVLIAKNILPAANVAGAVAASAIVMLVASLPISFAGWGLRELSASLAYAKIGFSTEQGLAVGAVIGLLSIVALACNAAWIGLRRHGPAAG